MILNQKQYKVTRGQIKRLQANLAAAKEKKETMDKRVYDAMIAGIKSKSAELVAQAKEFERIQGAKVLPYSLDDGFSDVLIKARVARGLTQKQLAERLGIDARQIQRYEKTNYSSVSLERVIAILKALNIEIRGRVSLRKKRRRQAA